MTVKELIEELKKFPLDMEIIGGSDKHDYPAELSIEKHYYREEVSEWTSDDDKRGKEVVVMWCSY